VAELEPERRRDVAIVLDQQYQATIRHVSDDSDRV
jgi:hypothetical protein